MGNNRLVAVVLCAVAAACFVYAAIATTWLYNPRNKHLMEVGFGLRTSFECDAPLGGESGECRTQSNSALVKQWTKDLARYKKEAEADPTNPVLQNQYNAAKDELRAPAVFPVFGWVTLVAIGIAALSLAVCAALALAKRRILWPMMPTTSAILGIAVGLVAGCVFVAMKPGPAGYVGVSYGFFAFGGGVIAGLAGAIMINKVLRPIDPDLLADSMDPSQY